LQSWGRMATTSSSSRWTTARSSSSSGRAVSDEPSPFALNPVIAGFLVDDIELARDELARTPGVELLGELYVMPDGYAWQVFRAPDGHAYELVAEARPPAEGEATH